MFIVSFNINGIRSHINQLEEIIKKYEPIFICLQETKVSNEKFPKEFFKKNKYYSYCNGYKNHKGVAIISKIKAEKIYINLIKIKENNLYSDYRSIACIFKFRNKLLFLINIYVPYCDNILNTIKFKYKLSFIDNINYIVNKIKNNNKYIIIAGDFNICPNYIDIGFNSYLIKKWIYNNKCSFLKNEIISLNRIFKDNIFIDSFRIINKNIKKYSWFSYLNKNFLKKIGLRIDLIILDNIFFNKYCVNSDIDYEIRSFNNTSDHAPIFIEIK